MRPIAILFLATTLAGLSTTGCQGNNPESGAAATKGAAPFDLAAAKELIKQKNDRFTNAHVIGDSVAMVDIFARDARAFPPNADAVVGRMAIEALTSQYLTLGITEFREESTKFYGNEEYLIDEGTYVMTYGKEKTTERGKYVNIWTREDGDWKLYSNMWNTNQPATP